MKKEINQKKYHAVFFAGDELPTALFLDAKTAVLFAETAPDWCDRNLQKVNVPDRFLKRDPKKNLKYHKPFIIEETKS